MGQIAPIPISPFYAVFSKKSKRNQRIGGRFGRFAVALFCIALAGCQTTNGSYCALADAQRPSQATIDAMTDAEVEKALIELEKGKRLCGWKTN